jgi:hypothetical protein
MSNKTDCLSNGKPLNCYSEKTLGVFTSDITSGLGANRLNAIVASPQIEFWVDQGTVNQFDLNEYPDGYNYVELIYGEIDFDEVNIEGPILKNGFKMEKVYFPYGSIDNFNSLQAFPQVFHEASNVVPLTLLTESEGLDGAGPVVTWDSDTNIVTVEGTSMGNVYPDNIGGLPSAITAWYGVENVGNSDISIYIPIQLVGGGGA